MKKDNISFPFANPTKKLKDDFKRMIDQMTDDEFVDMMAFLAETFFSDDYDEDCDCEECQEHKHFEDSFSGEMINFKCQKCKKISALPIEIANEIYEESQKQPDILCYHCESIAIPMYYKSPDNQIFKN